MNYAETLKDKPFKRPPVYEGFEGYGNGDNQRKIEEVASHYRFHKDVLLTYYDQRVSEGADPESPELIDVNDSILICITSAAEAESTDPDSDLQMHQLDLKAFALKNQIHDCEARHNIILEHLFEGGGEIRFETERSVTAA